MLYGRSTLALVALSLALFFMPRTDTVSSSTARRNIASFAVPTSSPCALVYIDFGTSVGRQLRKLFEPGLFPGNPTEPLFTEAFGSSAALRSDVCAYGFEPNPLHTAPLRALETAYRRNGFTVEIMTETAVSTKTGSATLFLDHGAGGAAHEWGTGLTKTFLAAGSKEKLDTVTVQTIDAASWMALHTRDAQRIVIKSDIEGLDMEVLDSLLASGQLCRVAIVYGEHWTAEWQTKTEALLARDDCRTRLVWLDDESGDDSAPLPS